MPRRSPGTFILATVGILLSGCGPQSSVVPIVPQEPSYFAEQVPDPLPPTRLGLWRDGAKTKPGDSVEQAMEVFPRPRNAAVFYDPPSVFSKEFRAKGWDNGREGFGVIATRGLVIVGLRIEYDVTQDRPYELVEQYRREHGNPQETIEDGPTAYWFWEQSPYRLAICRTTDADGRIALVSAVGLATAMEAISLSKSVASADASLARSLLSERSASADGR